MKFKKRKKKEEFLQEEAPWAQGLGVWEVAFTFNHLRTLEPIP